jgi:hypothetical protein
VGGEAEPPIGDGQVSVNGDTGSRGKCLANLLATTEARLPRAELLMSATMQSIHHVNHKSVRYRLVTAR